MAFGEKAAVDDRTESDIREAREAQRRRELGLLDAVFEEDMRRRGEVKPEAEPRRSEMSERELIGAIGMSPDLLPLIRSIVKAGDFYDWTNRAVFHAACKVADMNEQITAASVCAVLQKAGVLNRCGGDIHVERMLREHEALGAMSAAHAAESNARRVAEYAHARRIHERALDLARRAEDWKHPVAELVSFARTIERDASKSATVAVGLAHDAEAWGDDLVARAEGERVAGLRVQMPSVDGATLGFRGGEMVVIAARPGMGKTALALRWALNAAVSGDGVLFFSLEMPRAEILDRAVSMISGIPYSTILDPRGASPAVLNAATRAAHDLNSLPLYVIDVDRITIDELISLARAEVLQRTNVSAIVIDYAQLVASNRSYESREREVREVADGIKALAKSVDLPVFALAQLNRDVEKKGREPQLSDLRESGALEANADRVIFLHSDEADQNGDPMVPVPVSLIFRKQRKGRRHCSVTLNWTAGLVRFDDPAGGL